MKNKIRWRLIVGICLIGLLVIGWPKPRAGETAPKKSQPIKVAIICPQSGAGAYTGKAASSGAIVGLKEINAKGGILGGRTFEWIVLDDKSIPEEGVTNVNRAIASGCSGVLGAVNSAVALAENELLRRRGMPTIHLAAMHPKAANGKWGIFGRNLSTKKLQLIYAREIVLPHYKPKSVYFLREDTAFGKAMVAPFKSVFEEEGIKILGETKFLLEETDFGPLLMRALATKPHRIYYVGMDVMHKVKILREAQSRGIPCDNFILSGLDEELPELMGKYVEGMRGWSVWTRKVPTPESKRFVELYKKEWGKEPMLKYTSFGYESAWSMALAMEKAGTDRDIEKWKKSMLEISFEGPSGTLQWNAATGRPHPVLWETKVENGEVKLVRFIRGKVED